MQSHGQACEAETHARWLTTVVHAETTQIMWCLYLSAPEINADFSNTTLAGCWEVPKNQWGVLKPLSLAHPWIEILSQVSERIQHQPYSPRIQYCIKELVNWKLHVVSRPCNHNLMEKNCLYEELLWHQKVAKTWLDGTCNQRKLLQHGGQPSVDGIVWTASYLNIVASLLQHVYIYLRKRRSNLWPHFP